MFDSLFATGTSIGSIFLMMAIALVGGVLMAFLFSRGMRSGKGLFVTLSLLPLVVATTFCVLNLLIDSTTSAITSIAAIMVGLGLIRFRSAQGKAEEMLALFTAVAVGAANGMGYVALASVIAVVLPCLYLLISAAPIFTNKKLSREKLLKITIPETLEYGDAFDQTFAHYLKEVEMVGVKTTGMGSMFRLSYRIVMKDASEEKEMVDELRTRNGNLEISVVPYVDNAKEL